MNDQWKKIWDARKAEKGASNTLERLIRLDGFDTGAGRVEVADWEAHAQRIAEKLDIRSGDSLYEVGCGSGAFLYPFWQRGHQVGGLDYSPVLIEEARAVMAGGDFVRSEAIELEAQPQYDFVISHGVFHYFPDLAYAKQVFDRMIKKAKKSMAVLDVPNKMREAEAEDLRRGLLSPYEYDEKYKNLPRIYFRKEWFLDLANQYGCAAELFDQNIKSYGNSPFHFNVIMKI